MLGSNMNRRAFLFAASTMASALVINRATANGELEEGAPILRTRSAQFIFLKPVRTVPPISIPRMDGGADALSAFRGRVVLIHFWATWCPPCVDEIPVLDQLEIGLGGADFKTVAISLDRNGRDIEKFFQAFGIKSLTPYFDNVNRIGYFDEENVHNAPFALYGLPITYLIDRESQARGYIAGPVDWSADDARALLRYYIAHR